MRCGSPEELAVLRWTAEKAKDVGLARRVLLFGSRARGDADDRSDFDIAIETNHPEKLSALIRICEEHPLTLVSFDIVDLATVSPAFLSRILSEAKDITQL